MRRGLAVRSLALSLGLMAAGCVSRRSGYAVSEAMPALGTPYRAVLSTLGNPTAVRPLRQSGGFEAVWTGLATLGGEAKLGYWGLAINFGRTRSESFGRRMVFDAQGRLSGSWPVGPGEPAWGWFPFGEE